MTAHALTETRPHFLVYGSTGYLGSHICEILKTRGLRYTPAKARIQNVDDVGQELDSVKPTHVLHCAGLTGRPNIDWCEDHKLETVRVNVVGTLNLVDACYKRDIHITNYATGCIFNNLYTTGKFDEKKPGHAYTEEDQPNWTGSFYSITKAQAEFNVNQYPNALTLRVRMPITGDFNERNFIVKIAKYDKLINFPNSVTVLEDMLPISIDMTLDGCKGLYNFTNPGYTTHNEVMQFYIKYIDPKKELKNFTIEEQSKLLKSGRCNCILNTDKLTKMGYKVPTIQDSLVKVFEKMKQKKESMKQ